MWTAIQDPTSTCSTSNPPHLKPPPLRMWMIMRSKIIIKPGGKAPTELGDVPNPPFLTNSQPASPPLPQQRLRQMSLLVQRSLFQKYNNTADSGDEIIHNYEAC